MYTELEETLEMMYVTGAERECPFSKLGTITRVRGFFFERRLTQNLRALHRFAFWNLVCETRLVDL